MFRIFTFIALFCFTAAMAQTSVILGTITDDDALVMPGAEVYLEELQRQTITDEYGNYSFHQVPTGDYTLTVYALGYPITEKKVNVQGTVTRVDFRLNEGNLELNEVIVFGQRLTGQAKALNTQKSKNNISNVISADQVGRFPDANMGDALKRVPGVTMQQDQGEARDIVIRGLAPQLNSVTLNGDRIPSAEGDNRNVQMDLIPSDMIQTIELNKTLTPDMDADAIGGSVNLIRRSAPQQERISLTVGGGINAIRESGLFTASAVYGNRFLNNSLGMVFNASMYDTNYGSDNVEFTWAEDDFGNAYTDDYQVRWYNVQRKRRSAGLNFDLKLAEGHTLLASALYNWRDDNEDRYRLRYRSYDPVYDAANNIIGFEGGRIVRDNKSGKGGPRLERQTVQNYTFGGDHIFNKFKLDWGAAYSKAQEEKPDQRNAGFEIRGVDFTGMSGSTRFPVIRPLDMSLEDYATGPSQFTRIAALEAGSDITNEDEWAARLNIAFPFQVMSQPAELKVGGRMRLKSKMRDNGVVEYDPAGFDMSSMNVADLIYFDGNGFNPGSAYVPGFFLHNSWIGGLDIYNPAMFEKSEDASYYVENYKAEENIVAGYVRYDQQLSNALSFITGVRIEKTNTNYTGNVVEEDENLLGARSVKSDYVNILPGLTFNYRPSRNTVFRLAGTTSIARPNYYDIAPFVNVLPEDNEILAGNPNLEATKALNFDLMAEHYFQNVGIISGGVFYKHLTDFIYTSRNLELSNSQFAEVFPGVSNPVDAGDSWRLIRPMNGEKANFYGAEVAIQRQLDFLPGFLKDFGIYANYTYTKSEAKGVKDTEGQDREGLSLPGTAPHMANASISYDGKRFGARLSLNYAASYLSELGGDAFEDRYYDSQTFLDFNASYNFLKNFNLFVEINNITNQPLRFYQGIKDRTMSAEYYQTRYLFGIKFDLNNRD
ncbi:MAG: TonB-dependent receptor [Flavobacteriaceae bacterium]|nr:TonB-dependent receptor [Flavobacteriaceae bacterium]